MKPVLVITVCRRYHELLSNLEASRELFGEFSEPPAVVVVWARPEVGRLWLFQELLSQGKVDRVLSRPPLPGEGDGRQTTYPESRNIRVALEHVRDCYGPSSYAVVQAADVRPRAQAYAFIDRHMQAGGGAVVFHWPNGCVPRDIWHTNFFAVSTFEQYWPPVLGPESGDTLELAWGKCLVAVRPPGVLESHNSRGRKFSHAHESEGLPPLPLLHQKLSAGAPLFVSGRLPWWRRVLSRLRRCIPF